MNSPIQKLLKSANPSIRLRTMLELLDYNTESDEVLNARKEVESSEAVLKLLKKMHPDGYWLQTNPRTKQTLGDGVEYGSYATTHFILSYLSELGLNNQNAEVFKASERYLNLISEEGDWWLHMSCLNGYNIRTFVRLGYKNDSRLRRVIDLMLETDRRDGGYLCDMHEKKRKNKKSCYRGAAKMLMAFSEYREIWEHPRCIRLVNYFLERKVIYNSKGTRYVNKDVQFNSYPITWGTNLFEVLLALSVMGYSNHEALNDAWELLDSKANEDGEYILDQTPGQSPFKAGAKGQPNEWLNFYVALTKKYKS